MHRPRAGAGHESSANARGATADAAAKSLLDQLARSPRGAGSSGERRAREACTDRLRNAGFTVRDAPFEYSAFAGRWATPLAGTLALGTLATSGHLGAHGWSARAMIVLVAGLAVIGAFARWAARNAVLDAPLLKRKGVNLVATRGIGWPRVWLVAHLDSKSQPVPIGVRALGVVVTALACIAMAALCMGALGGAPLARPGQAAWLVVTIAGAAGALPLVLSVVGDSSPGALDNASGVVSVILAAEAVPAEASIGVLLTSAEELGLAGARAWTQKLERAWSRVRSMDAAPAIALNCDGIDDHGMLTVMRARGGDLVVTELTRAAAIENVPLRTRRLLPGLLVDAVAFADGGWQAATLSRGSLATLLRIHTRADTAQRMSGAGIAEAARVLARAAGSLARR